VVQLDALVVVEVMAMEVKVQKVMAFVAFVVSFDSFESIVLRVVPNRHFREEVTNNSVT
jgi:hypothetical protein